MARPQVFLSSTFYDLKQVRSDLDHFIREMGYDPVRNERGNIPYPGSEQLQESAYREVERSDIVVSIIGGRYGSESNETPYSISQKELKRAIDTGKQLFIFVARDVLGDYNVWKLNKEKPDISFPSVNDTRVFSFLDFVEALPMNNAMAPFDESREITSYLREQWAGLFQRFLQEQRKAKELELLESLRQTSMDLAQLVKETRQDTATSNLVIKSVLFDWNPACEQVRRLLEIKFRAYFMRKSELSTLLEALGFSEAEPELGYLVWWRDLESTRTYVKVAVSIFDNEGRLKVYSSATWKEEWIQRDDEALELCDQGITDDDVPF